MPSRDDVVELARSYLGVKWMHQGRTRLGIDCAGLVIEVGNELELLDNFKFNEYPRKAISNAFLKAFRENMDRVTFQEAKIGDVMLFRDSQFPCHCGILGWKNNEMTFVHAHALSKQVVEDALADGDWLDRKVAVFRYRGIEDG